MQNEEVIIPHDPGKACHLRLKRKWHFVECLSKVIIRIDGNEVTALKNGEEILVPVKPGSVIELDLQSPAWHNFYKVEITGLPEIVISFSWFGSGAIFKHNNIRLLGHSGCRITETDKEQTKLQKMDNKMSMWFIGILMAAYVVLQLSQCHFRIHW